jgi:hypothetical protein
MHFEEMERRMRFVNIKFLLNIDEIEAESVALHFKDSHKNRNIKYSN